MRENRTCGSEGGSRVTDASLPLSQDAEVSFSNGASAPGGLTNLNLGGLYFWESRSDPDLRKKAKDLTLRAIELAPQDAPARGNLAVISFAEAAQTFAAGGELGVIKERTEGACRLLGRRCNSVPIAEPRWATWATATASWLKSWKAVEKQKGRWIIASKPISSTRMR